MDSLFDDDIDEVGSEIEAYCPSPRCKADTNHTIISMYEDEVRRVQCSVCNDVHAYRKPRGDSVDDEPSRSRRPTRKPSWQEAMAQVSEHDLASCRPYSIRDSYEEFDIVSHPTFDIGFVTELLPDNKLEITFKDERRVLVHNRADLASKMPGIADVPAPRQKKRRRRKKQELRGLLGKKPANEEANQIDARALAQAEAARREAAEKAAEAKRRLATQLVAEKIKAKRLGKDSSARRGGRKQRGGAEPAGARRSVPAPAAGSTGPKGAAKPARARGANGAKVAATAARATPRAAKKAETAAAVKLGAKKVAREAGGVGARPRRASASPRVAGASAARPRVTTRSGPAKKASSRRSTADRQKPRRRR